jgi:hypothetical protein
MRTLLASCLALAVCGMSLAAPKSVKPNREWTGLVADEALKKLAPVDGYVLDAKEFDKLWKAWSKDEKVPTIDFAKEVVIVTLATGPNEPTIKATLDDGKLQIKAGQALVAGKGFGYSLATFDRKGITTVRNKKLPVK